ncbi:uncharacterized protein LOC123662084 [Melitaea cinxia]|uniref:uncharacterized protein LOC123662084 n=1 Tax=Melitaea cinxia TaxID=113334 RepID=UPI001E27456E|nr:uncharacterized protein LOC123662084 [Melitaea cinxia]
MSTSTIQNVEACSQSHNFNNVPKLIIATNQNNNSNWKKWWQCFELFLLASDLEDASEKRKIAIMLHTIGEKGIEIYNSFNIDITRTTLKDIKIKFDNYFEPQKNLTIVRHSFFTRMQKPEEGIDTFLTDLQNIGNKCEFGTLKHSLIKDIFIANMSSRLTHVRQRLLQETDLTLEKAISIANNVIMAQQNAQTMENSQYSDNVLHLSQSYTKSQSKKQSTSNNRNKSNNKNLHNQNFASRRSQSPVPKTSNNNKCTHCGQCYHRFKCPASGVRCKICHKIGHFAKYCFSNRSNIRSVESSYPVRDVNEKSNNDSEQFFIGMVKSVNNDKSWMSTTCLSPQVATKCNSMH